MSDLSKVEQEKLAAKIREQVGVVLLCGVLASSGYILIREQQIDSKEIKFVNGSNADFASTMEVSKAQGEVIASGSNEIKSKLVNINTASIEELDTLPGVGPATAQKIIDYRLKNGLFRSKEDVLKVSGIGDSKYSQIKSLITI